VLFDKTRALKHVEEREAQIGKEVKLSALEMLALREKELDEKKKEQVRRRSFALSPSAARVLTPRTLTGEAPGRARRPSTVRRPLLHPSNLATAH